MGGSGGLFGSGNANNDIHEHIQDAISSMQSTTTPAPAPTAPTPTDPALDEAEQKRRMSGGGASDTLFAGRQRSGMSSGTSGGSYSRMLLGS